MPGEASSEQPRSFYRWVILAVAILAYGTTQFSRQSFTGVQKFIAADLGMDKGALGLLASVFFYSYALFQMPWGVASDRFGSRWVIGIGIMLTAATTLGFATGQTEQSLLLWRIGSGVAGAAIYVPLAGTIAKWFPDSQRGLSQASLGGVGGSLGEVTAYLLLPVLTIYFASGWRQGMVTIGVVIAALGILCVALLKSAPPNAVATTRKPFEMALLGDAHFWCYVTAGTQTWIAVYAADVYIARYGMSINQAIVAGALLTVGAYSLLGRAIGCPLAGRWSDVLARKGISRTIVIIGWLLFAIVLELILSLWVSSIWSLALVAVLLGTSVNLFALVPAAVSESYGPLRTASISSFTNTVGQLAGASVLALSGYVGVSLNSQPGNSLSDYMGIWLTAATGMAVMAVLSIGCYIAMRSGAARTRRHDIRLAAEG
jgi:MFS family permease